MTSSSKMIASEICMAALKYGIGRIPLVGSAVVTAMDFAETIQKRYDALSTSEKLEQLQAGQSNFEKNLHQLVRREIEATIAGLRSPDMDGASLTKHIRTFQEIQQQGWAPAVFQGILENSPHWDDLKRYPMRFGRILPDGEALNPEMIHILFDSDKTRVLEMPAHSFATLLTGQRQGSEKPQIIGFEDLWAVSWRGAGTILTHISASRAVQMLDSQMQSFFEARHRQEAISWLKREAPMWIDTWQVYCQMGVPQALYLFATCLQFGNGIEADPERAIEYLEQAAAQGLPAAMTSLSSTYQLGIGVPKNAAKANQWHEQVKAEIDQRCKDRFGPPKER